MPLNEMKKIRGNHRSTTDGFRRRGRRFPSSKKVHVRDTHIFLFCCTYGFTPLDASRPVQKDLKIFDGSGRAFSFDLFVYFLFCFENHSIFGCRGLYRYILTFLFFSIFHFVSSVPTFRMMKYSSWRLSCNNNIVLAYISFDERTNQNRVCRFLFVRIKGNYYPPSHPLCCPERRHIKN